jgi:hypothetical protein
MRTTRLKEYGEWPPGTPRTNPHAKVNRWVQVENITAVRIKNGTYRNALLSDVFELYDSRLRDPVEIYRGGPRVQVVCSWYGGKPNGKSGARIDVSGKSCEVEILPNYSGEVADCIGPEEHDFQGGIISNTQNDSRSSDADSEFVQI